MNKKLCHMKIFILIYLISLNIQKVFTQDFALIGDAIEAFSPCKNGVLVMERMIGGPPNKENYWDGSLYLDKYPNLSEARVIIKFDAPANVSVSENDGRANVIDDSFYIHFFKNEDNFKTVKFKVKGVPKGKFPNVEKLELNNVNICPNPEKWSPSILGPSVEATLIDNRGGTSSPTSATNITSTSQVCGRRLIQHQGLVLSGYPSQEGDWPWHAGVYHQSATSDFLYKCGGTLINSNTVLTAGHCVVEGGRFIIANRVLVRLGQHNRLVGTRNTQEFLVFKIVPHPEFGFNDLKNDIALLKLATEPTLSHYVQPACLWPSNDKSLDSVIGKKGYVVGWGYNTEKKLSDILIQAQMPVVSLTDCLASNRDFFGIYLSDKNYCAGFRNGTSVCNGDSGGGMFFKQDDQFFIRGLVSLSVSKETENICDSKHYVIFTDAAKYLDWIETNLNDVNNLPI